MNNNKLKLTVFTVSALSIMMADVAAMGRNNNDQHNFGEQNIAARRERAVQSQRKEEATRDLVAFLNQTCRRAGENPEDDRKFVESFIKKGADVDVDKYSDAPLVLAIRNCKPVAATVLVEHGANANAAAREDGSTALMLAAARGYTNTVNTLIEHGADVNAGSKSGWTALMSAAAQGHIDTVNTLIKHGADVNAGSKSGWTALMSAAAKGHTEMVNTLIKNGADVNAKNTDEKTAMMLAALRKRMETVNTLREHGANM